LLYDCTTAEALVNHGSIDNEPAHDELLKLLNDAAELLIPMKYSLVNVMHQAQKFPNFQSVCAAFDVATINPCSHL